MVSGNRVVVEGKLSLVKEGKLNSMRLIGLRLYNTTLGKSGTASLKVKEKLRDALITPAKASKIIIKREIILHDDMAEITDTITSPEPIKKVHACLKYSFAFVPSSRLFQDHELENKPIVLQPNTSSVTIKRVIHADGRVEIG